MLFKKIVREILFVLLILGAAYYYFAVYPKRMVRDHLQTLDQDGTGEAAGRPSGDLPKEP